MQIIISIYSLLPAPAWPCCCQRSLALHRRFSDASLVAITLMTPSVCFVCHVHGCRGRIEEDKGKANRHCTRNGSASGQKVPQGGGA